MRCDPRFKWLSVVTIYVVCIVCLLDACPPSSMLDHNTCASNPEQANSQVKNTVCNRPTTILSNILCNDTRRFLFDCHFIIFRFYFFTISFFLHLFLYYLYLPCVSYYAQCTEGIWYRGRLGRSTLAPTAWWQAAILFTHH